MDEVTYSAGRPDVSEDALHSVPGLLEALLADHADRGDGKTHNIVWATDDYSVLGHSFADEVRVEDVTGVHGRVIVPRSCKPRSVQDARRRGLGEVMTPLSVVRVQNDLVDAAWGRARGDDWQAYVRSPRLELACGEAPYLTSRYDVVSGHYIDVGERPGLLDRKLRAIAAHVGPDDVPQWRQWARLALEATYGFEWQGDSLLLARENVLCSVVEHYLAFRQCQQMPLADLDRDLCLTALAEVVAWNLWQMDALKGVVPGSCHQQPKDLNSLVPDTETLVPCPGCADESGKTQHNGWRCRVIDWTTDTVVTYDATKKKPLGR